METDLRLLNGPLMAMNGSWLILDHDVISGWVEDPDVFYLLYSRVFVACDCNGVITSRPCLLRRRPCTIESICIVRDRRVSCVL